MPADAFCRICLQARRISWVQSATATGRNLSISFAIGYAAGRLKNDERTRRSRRSRRAVSDMNLKRLTGRSCLPDCEGDPASMACTTHNAVRAARIRGKAGTGNAMVAALLAGAMFLCSPVFAAPATGDGAISLAAGAPSTCTNVAAAASYPVANDPEAPPPLKGRVTDMTGVLSVACASELTDRLADLERRLGVQMAILLVGSTGHATIEQFATAVFEKWRLGQSKIDNGLLLVAALNDRTVRVEVGYGLEGAIPDVVAGRIIRERIVPAFREKRIEAGVSDAVDALVREMTPPQMAESDSALPDEDAQRVTSSDASRLSNGLRKTPPADLGSFLFWLLLGLTGVVLGVVTEWRKLRWQVMLPASFLVATIVPVAMLPVGAIFEGELVAMLGGLGFVATSMGGGAWLLGIGLVRSARVRKNTAIIGVTLLTLIGIGHLMGYSPGEVLLTVFCVVMGILVIVEKLTGSDWSSSSSTSSSSSFKWPSSGSGSSSSSSSDSFTGGGGSSGGGGASGRW
ncbi:TPM domain-containing protein [Burkholderia diffusa]|uniref:TPM domain-containing protein n=1 Tax=Burkholderia diffusa TaxID=488732 RepID=UPI0018C577AE|nr:TPM domain-containing protein [Burkholderia diffusa]